MATREVAQAKADLDSIEQAYRQATGVFRTRQEQARLRLSRALEAQNRLKAEYDRLVYTLGAAFDIHLGQQTLSGPPPAPAGGRPTFIVKQSPTAIRRRLRELRAKLNEAPG